MVAAYIVFTQKVTDWRNGLRARRNDLDTGAGAHAVDSLLNFETVKYFGAEEREARRYDRAVEAYAAAAVKSENSLALLKDRKSVVSGKSVSVRVDLGGRRNSKKTDLRTSYG